MGKPVLRLKRRRLVTMPKNKKIILEDLRKEALFLAVKNSRDIDKESAAEKAKVILEESDEIFGNFKEELDYLDKASKSTLRQSLIPKMVEKGIFKATIISQNGKDKGADMRSHQLKIDLPLNKIKLKHRKWLVIPEEKEKKKYFLDLRKNAKKAQYYLESDSHSFEEYGSARDNLLHLIEYRDLYSIAYKNESLMEYFENAYIIFESNPTANIRLAPEFPFYLKLWKKAIENDYQALIQKEDSLKILLGTVDHLSMIGNFRGSHGFIKSIAEKAKKKDLYEGEDKEKLEEILERVK